jgi:hypothetical protein
MLVQLPAETSEAVRGQARAWIWHQWQERKTSYLTVKIHDEESEETSSYFIAPDKNGEWEVTIQVHRIVRDENATASQLRVSESELLVAPQVQRVEPTTDEMQLPRVFSKDEILPASKYRLQFLDYGSRTVATL